MEKDINELYLLTIVAMILFAVITIINSAIIKYPSENVVKIVDCFDDNHNKILNASCEDVTIGMSNESKLFATGLINFASTVVIVYLFLKWRIDNE